MVIVSGGRWATVKGRAPYLPAADAYVSDNGGRIFWASAERAHPSSSEGTESGGGAAATCSASDRQLVEDLAWRAHLASGGAIGGVDEVSLRLAALLQCVNEWV